MFTTTDLGEVLLLKYMLNHTPADDVKLHLYKNNLTPSESDTLNNYTESAATGYSVIPLPGSSWTFATAGGTSTASFPQQTFTYTTSESVYGYYITNAAETTLIWAERFTGAPFTIPSGGGTVDLDIRIEVE